METDIKALQGMVMEPGEDGTWTIKLPVLTTEEKTAELAQTQIARDVAGFNIGGVEVGKGVAGGAIAVAAVELLDGLAPNFATQNRAMAKLGLAWAVANFGPRFLGDDIAQSAAGFIVFDAARQALPIDEQIKKIVGRVSQTAGSLTGSDSADMKQLANLGQDRSQLTAITGRQALVGL